MLRTLIVVFSILVGLILLAIAFTQRRELVSLKLEENELRQQATEPLVQPVADVTITPSPQHTPSSELLRLRGEVGQLERRKHELAGARAENETLRAQLVTKGTNASGGIALPRGYLRKADAKLAGFNTPEDTIQSMLWAIQNRDTATFLQVFGPEMAKQMESQIQQRASAEEFFKEADVMPGWRVIGREHETDGSTVLTVLILEVIPRDETHSQKVRFKQIAGQWKLISGF